MGNFLWEVAPRCPIEFLRKVERSCGFRLKITDHAFPWTQHEIHGVPVRRAFKCEEPVVVRRCEELRQVFDCVRAHIGGIPRFIHSRSIHLPRPGQLAEDDAWVLFVLMNGGYRPILQRSGVQGVIAHHVGIEVVVGAVVEDLGHRVAGKKPHTRVSNSAGFPEVRKQRRDLVAQPETVAVQQLDGIKHFSLRFLIGPTGDVIPKAWLHETAVGEEEPPDGLRLLAGCDRGRLGEDVARHRLQVRGIGLALLQHYRRIDLRLDMQRAQEERSN